MKNLRQLTLIQVAQNQKHTNTSGLEKLLKLKNGAKAMFTDNISIQACLIYSQISSFKLNVNSNLL